MLAKLTQVISSFIVSCFEGVISSTVLLVVQDLIKKGRNLLLIIMSSFIFSLLFAGGVLLSVFEASMQYDTKGYIFLSALLTSGLILSAVSLIGLIIIFYPRASSASLRTANQHKTQSRSNEQNTPQHMSMEDIIGLVVTEGVQYFKDKNAAKPAQNQSRDYFQA